MGIEENERVLGSAIEAGVLELECVTRKLGVTRLYQHADHSLPLSANTRLVLLKSAWIYFSVDNKISASLTQDVSTVAL